MGFFSRPLCLTFLYHPPPNFTTFFPQTFRLTKHIWLCTPSDLRFPTYHTGGSDQGSSRAILSRSSFCKELLPLAGRQCHAHRSLPRRQPLLSQCRPAIIAPCPTSKVSSVSTFPKPLVAPPSFLEIQDESGVDRNLPHICPFGQWEMKGDPWVKLTKLRDRLEPGWGVKQGKGSRDPPPGGLWKHIQGWPCLSVSRVFTINPLVKTTQYKLKQTTLWPGIISSQQKQRSYCSLLIDSRNQTLHAPILKM